MNHAWKEENVSEKEGERKGKGRKEGVEKKNAGTMWQQNGLKKVMEEINETRKGGRQGGKVLNREEKEGRGSAYCHVC